MSARTTLENRFYELFQEYFYKAEKHRRWNVFDDIPWAEASKNPDPNVALLVESFFAVELFLPDYVRHIMRMVRKSRGRAWFQANWGYEECKHSMALEKWLLTSGARTDEQLQTWEHDVLEEEWTLHYGDEQLLSLCYTVLQEFATGLTYRRLKSLAEEKGIADPALSQTLSLLHRDEIGHFNFFKSGLELYMEHDRDLALEAMTHVLQTFHMPGADLIPGWDKRDALIREWDVMTDRVFMKDVVKPVLKNLGIEHGEMREIRRRLKERQENAPESITQLVVIDELTFEDDDQDVAA